VSILNLVNGVCANTSDWNTLAVRSKCVSFVTPRRMLGSRRWLKSAWYSCSSWLERNWPPKRTHPPGKRQVRWPSAEWESEQEPRSRHRFRTNPPSTIREDPRHPDHRHLARKLCRGNYCSSFSTHCQWMFDLDAIMDDIDRKSFKMLFSPAHSLHLLLPPVRSNPYRLRSRDHNLQLPVCNLISALDVTLLFFYYTQSLSIYIAFRFFYCTISCFSARIFHVHVLFFFTFYIIASVTVSQCFACTCVSAFNKYSILNSINFLLRVLALLCCEWSSYWLQADFQHLTERYASQTVHVTKISAAGACILKCGVIYFEI